MKINHVFIFDSPLQTKIETLEHGCILSRYSLLLRSILLQRHGMGVKIEFQLLFVEVPRIKPGFLMIRSQTRWQ